MSKLLNLTEVSTSMVKNILHIAIITTKAAKIPDKINTVQLFNVLSEDVIFYINGETKKAIATMSNNKVHMSFISLEVEEHMESDFLRGYKLTPYSLVNAIKFKVRSNSLNIPKKMHDLNNIVIHDGIMLDDIILKTIMSNIELVYEDSMTTKGSGRIVVIEKIDIN